MNRIAIFFAGVAVGAVLMFVGLRYHVVRADDGVHFVPKVSGGFADPYVDIREFGLSEWDNHRSLAAAIVRADKQHLMKGAAESALRNSVDKVLETLSLPGS